RSKRDWSSDVCSSDLACVRQKPAPRLRRGLEEGVALEVKLPVPYGADKTMRIIIAFASVLLSGAALADSVLHPSVPERLWGTWAPSADLCTDSKSTFVVSAKGYVTSQANCAI